jgi:hypothetical protein
MPHAKVTLDSKLCREGKAEETRRHLDETRHENHTRGVLDVDAEQLIRLSQRLEDKGEST